MREKTATMAGAAIFGVLGCAAFIKAGAYQSGGANLFPQAVAAGMALCAVGLALAELRRGDAAGAPAAESLEEALDTLGPRMLWAIVLSAAFVVAIPLFGIATSSFLLIALGCWTLGLRRPVVVLGGAAAFALIVPFLFRHFLHIRPPQELLARLLALV